MVVVVREERKRECSGSFVVLVEMRGAGMRILVLLCDVLRVVVWVWWCIPCVHKKIFFVKWV